MSNDQTHERAEVQSQCTQSRYVLVSVLGGAAFAYCGKFKILRQDSRHAKIIIAEQFARRGSRNLPFRFFIKDRDHKQPKTRWPTPSHDGLGPAVALQTKLVMIASTRIADRWRAECSPDGALLKSCSTFEVTEEEEVRGSYVARTAMTDDDDGPTTTDGRTDDYVRPHKHVPDMRNH